MDNAFGLALILSLEEGLSRIDGNGFNERGRFQFYWQSGDFGERRGGTSETLAGEKVTTAKAHCVDTREMSLNPMVKRIRSDRFHRVMSAAGTGKSLGAAGPKRERKEKGIRTPN